MVKYAVPSWGSRAYSVVFGRGFPTLVPECHSGRDPTLAETRRR